MIWIACHLAGGVSHQDNSTSGHVLFHCAPEGIISNVWHLIRRLIERIISNVWHLICNVWYLICNVWFLISNVWYLISNVWCLFRCLFDYLRACWASLVSRSTSVSTTTLELKSKLSIIEEHQFVQVKLALFCFTVGWNLHLELALSLCIQLMGTCNSLDQLLENRFIKCKTSLVFTWMTTLS